jgi:hypothetical protein
MGKTFTITEIENGWLIQYYTEYGQVQRFFQDIDDIVYILKNIVTTENPLTNTTKEVKNGISR